MVSLRMLACHGTAWSVSAAVLNNAPELEFGDRFRVKSKRGTVCCVEMLSRGNGESGLYVRMDDGRIARLDGNRLDWSTFEDLSRASEPLLREGDQILVESASGPMRGTLICPIDRQVVFRPPIGKDFTLALREITEFHLLFRARDLRPGDQFTLRSLSGNDYYGQIVHLGPGRRLMVELKNGRRVSLRMSKIDLSSLFVLVPIPCELLGKRG